MEGKVVLTLSSLHRDLSAADDTCPAEEKMSFRADGSCRFENDTHFIDYTEPADEENSSAGSLACRLIISQDSIELIKSGVVDTHMVFVRDKVHRTSYNTEFGMLDMSFSTSSLCVSSKPDALRADLCYVLSVNSAPVSECRMEITAFPI